MRFFEGNLGQNLTGDFLTAGKKKLFFHFFCYSRGLGKNYYNSNNWRILILIFVQSKIFLDNLHLAFEDHHCVKSVRIQSYFGLHFPTFRLNTEIYGVSFPIQSKWEKNADQNNSEYGHFLRGANIPLCRDDLIKLHHKLNDWLLYWYIYWNFFLEIDHFRFSCHILLVIIFSLFETILCVG